MSSNDGIYILQTQGPEYRIVYAQAIDNIYGDFDDKENRWKGNPESILDTFGASDVYTDLEKAWDQAMLMAEEYEWLEDGVCLIRDFEGKKFSDVIDGISK
jgi:hypothetical protein